MVECFSEATPLLALQQGGVAERSIRCREASIVFARPGWFSDWKQKGTPPRLRPVKVASPHFVSGAATPPRADARRGIRLIETSSRYFHGPIDGAYRLIFVDP